MFQTGNKMINCLSLFCHKSSGVGHWRLIEYRNRGIERTYHSNVADQIRCCTSDELMAIFYIYEKMLFNKYINN